eukprot:PhF_6_TR26704/c0_g1_i1/m.39003
MIECWGCGHTKQRKHLANDVFVNVYDITRMNYVVGWMGLGMYHTGVEVFQKEYGFGRDISGTGVFAITPKSYHSHIFRETIYIGQTTFSEAEVECLLESMAEEWQCETYHLTKRNCNDFSEQLARALVGEDIASTAWPTWVNQTARTATAILPTSWTEYMDSVDLQMFKDSMALVELEQKQQEEEQEMRRKRAADLDPIRPEDIEPFMPVTPSPPPPSLKVQ